MIYEYKCTNIQCEERNVVLTKDIPMAEAGETQHCEKCEEALQKIYGIAGHSTFGDGYKS